jgi:hypothetical protein
VRALCLGGYGGQGGPGCSDYALLIAKAKVLHVFVYVYLCVFAGLLDGWQYDFILWEH